MKSRRQFIKTAGTGILAAGVTGVYGNGNAFAPAKITGDAFTLGMAGYTFREFTVEQTIDMMKRTGVSNLSLKDFHLPYDSTQEQINEVLQKFKNAGITVYTLGVIYMKTRESVDQAFEYAKMAGVDMIVGAPDYELLSYVEKKVKTYAVRLAIHNHGPDNPLYPNATDIWNHIKDLDPGMGICIDIGHTTRDGEDPSVDIEKYSSRIYDMHIKDVDKPAKEGTTVEIGRGIIDIPRVIATLRKINYSGKCSLEFEKDMKDPLAGIAESLGYWKGVAAVGYRL
ncbi:MAG TPA: sugar phosphate isomerase/epimerase family protein [Bacteroidales bacterium]|nr:sugar phosphate isomerase/epimerase family protein [Bacteroidales bacterium]